MNAHALGILEFSRLMAHVAGRAASAPGAAAVRALAPRADREWIEAEHARVAAVRSQILSELGWPSEAVPELGEALKRLRIAGITWSALELLQGAILLRSSRRTREALRDPRRPAITLAYLSAYAERLVDLRAREEAIERAIADDGTVKDDASPTLRRVRRELRQAEGELVRLLEREMGKLEAHHQVSDLSVTMRNGRWVMPMRREARGYVGGIVHDSSGTGATIFVEPPAAVEFGNRVRELELEEQREVEKVLRDLTEELHPYHEAMLDAWRALVALDALYARARYSLEANCAPLEFGEPADGVRIVNGRHPLLLASGVPVVSFDLTLTADERTLLVSGPNTGGKTVLLKATGLLCMMAQAGVPAPVGSMSCLPVFDDVFADVGDEQSIEASLSTFSAHLKNLGEILQSASPSALVLIDELGSGTDPAEGAALGGSILETLTVRGTLTLATTHLGQLKLLATEVPGVVNASLQFDAVQLAPTYRLLKGVPGRSYGLSIARRLQLPEAVILRAEERLPQGERDLAVLLADVEAREAVLSDREQLLEREQERVRSRLSTVADRELKVREREREAERTARQEARRYLLEARGQLEQAIASVKSAASAATGAGTGELDETARAARRKLEDAAAEQGQAAEAVAQRGVKDRARAEQKQRAASPQKAATPPVEVRPLAEGDNVLVGTLGDKVGRIAEIRGSDARVVVGSLTLTVPMRVLTRSKAAPAPMLKVSLVGDMAEVEPVREVDVRGLRVDEVDDQVLQALDAAVRNDLRELRIIHGKGTGALRSRVSEMLKKDTRVTGFRLGAWNEGGAGVTVADLA
ncbi:MAG: Smr/MutS family protein [Gemmatimonadaceae bacterium]|nr:Smr/MutS family protein [Gemmatimonadaceae bacterium]